MPKQMSLSISAQDLSVQCNVEDETDSQQSPVAETTITVDIKSKNAFSDRHFHTMLRTQPCNQDLETFMLTSRPLSVARPLLTKSASIK